MASFNTASFPDSLAIAKEETLTIGNIDEIQVAAPCLSLVLAAGKHVGCVWPTHRACSRHARIPKALTQCAQKVLGVLTTRQAPSWHNTRSLSMRVALAQKLHIRTVPLHEQPRRIAHQDSTRSYAVTTTKATFVGGEHSPAQPRCTWLFVCGHCDACSPRLTSCYLVG